MRAHVGFDASSENDSCGSVKERLTAWRMSSAKKGVVLEFSLTAIRSDEGRLPERVFKKFVAAHMSVSLSGLNITTRARGPPRTDRKWASLARALVLSAGEGGTLSSRSQMMTSEEVLSDFSSMRSAVAGTACTLNTLEQCLDKAGSEW